MVLNGWKGRRADVADGWKRVVLRRGVERNLWSGRMEAEGWGLYVPVNTLCLMEC